MPIRFSPERLADLLIDLREDLDLEIKSWLDLRGDNEAKATFAKATLALANHGGGKIEDLESIRKTEGRRSRVQALCSEIDFDFLLFLIVILVAFIIVAATLFDCVLNVAEFIFVEVAENGWQLSGIEDGDVLTD